MWTGEGGRGGWTFRFSVRAISRQTTEEGHYQSNYYVLTRRMARVSPRPLPPPPPKAGLVSDCILNLANITGKLKVKSKSKRETIAQRRRKRGKRRYRWHSNCPLCLGRSGSVGAAWTEDERTTQSGTTVGRIPHSLFRVFPLTCACSVIVYPDLCEHCGGRPVDFRLWRGHHSSCSYSALFKADTAEQLRAARTHTHKYTQTHTYK